MVDKQKSRKGVQSVGRAMDILELLGRLGPTGVTDIARQLDLHVATVHNLLRTLADRHYLLNDGGQYRIGPAASILAGQFAALADAAHSLSANLGCASEHNLPPVEPDWADLPNLGAPAA